MSALITIKIKSGLITRARIEGRPAFAVAHTQVVASEPEQVWLDWSSRFIEGMDGVEAKRVNPRAR